MWVSSGRTGTLGKNLPHPAARGIRGIKDQQSMKGCSDCHSPVQPRDSSLELWFPALIYNPSQRHFLCLLCNITCA